VEEDEYTEEAEDDGLGYYEDGVKRTLTDEQIAIFRHSEIQTLLRNRRHAEEAIEDEHDITTLEETGPMMDESVLDQDKSPALEHVEPFTDEGELEDGELDDDLSTSQSTALQPPQNQKNKKNKGKKNKKAKKGQRPPPPKGFFKQNVKPDLRKRTWDKVDAGLGNLDYDEESGAASMPSPAAQRRRISYDDD
jgi:hypothetical protein